MAGKHDKILKNYDAYCADGNLKVSTPRRHVLGIVLESEKPLTAYEILDKLGEKLKSPKPPTVYRALEALSEHGFLHRIESLNAYIACDENHRHKGSQFMICDSCGRVEEVHLCHVPAALKDQATSHGFQTQYWNAELHGHCANCI